MSSSMVAIRSTSLCLSSLKDQMGRKSGVEWGREEGGRLGHFVTIFLRGFHHGKTGFADGFSSWIGGYTFVHASVSLSAVADH